jgi:hypothetical protein
MKLGLVIDHIAAGDLGFKHVGGVKRVADLARTPAPMPACFVIPAEETIRSVTEGPGLIDLESTFSFDVVALVTGASQRGRDEDELTDFHDALVTRLMGWTPEPALYRPIVPVAARLLGLEAGRASWITRFRTVFHYRKQGN